VTVSSIEKPQLSLEPEHQLLNVIASSRTNYNMTQEKESKYVGQMTRIIPAMNTFILSDAELIVGNGRSVSVGSFCIEEGRTQIARLVGSSGVCPGRSGTTPSLLDEPHAQRRRSDLSLKSRDAAEHDSQLLLPSYSANANPNPSPKPCTKLTTQHRDQPSNSPEAKEVSRTFFPNRTVQTPALPSARLSIRRFVRRHMFDPFEPSQPTAAQSQTTWRNKTLMQT
jgi:hypothetical protein